MTIIKKDSIYPLNFGDLVIFDYTAGLGTSSSFAIIVVPPRCGHAKAKSRKSDKYYYVKSGIVNFMINDEEFILFSGDLLLVEKNKWFSYQNKSSSSAELILIHTPRFSLEEEEFERS